MKKLLLSFTLLFGVIGVVGVACASDMVPVPKNQDGIAINDASYGGMLFATAAFFTSGTNGTITIPSGYSEIGLLGATISSGPGTTFIEFFSSYGWSPTVQSFARITNSTNAVTTSVSGTDRWYPVPYRVPASTFTTSGQAATAPGLIFRVTNGDNTQQLHNLMTVGYVLK